MVATTTLAHAQGAAPPAGKPEMTQSCPGLIASRQPDPSEETNSSWSYTGQWFLFALTALVIYALALRKRWREAGTRAQAAKR